MTYQKMHVLLINKFLFPKGGGDISTIETGKLLKEKGHTVYYWGMKHKSNPEYIHRDTFVSSVDYNNLHNLPKLIKSSVNILYSFEAKAKLEKLLKRINPDIIHLNSIAHQISPSILDTIHKMNIPVIMTMRDHKLVCACYLMRSGGKACEKCKSGRYYHCFLRKCTKDSYLKSLLNTIEMYLHHKILRIYNKIDLFISPSEFLKQKIREMGFIRPIKYLPNFVDLKNYKPDYNNHGKTIIYAGRLSPEKGLVTLIDAVKDIDVKLQIIGDGPLRSFLEKKIQNENISNVLFSGYLNREYLIRETKKSLFGILPSECYENNPRFIIETFSLGKPVIGSRIGGIPELVIDGKTGFTFTPHNTSELKTKIKILLENRNLIIKMGKEARKFVEEQYNSDLYYRRLYNIYSDVIKKRKTYRG